MIDLGVVESVLSGATNDKYVEYRLTLTVEEANWLLNLARTGNTDVNSVIREIVGREIGASK
jgi:hypothetical protein